MYYETVKNFFNASFASLLASSTKTLDKIMWIMGGTPRDTSTNHNENNTETGTITMCIGRQYAHNVHSKKSDMWKDPWVEL
jgi:hypothetical protein